MNDQEQHKAKNQNIAIWEDFQVEIKNRADELASQLPSTITRERFINASIAAVKQTPDILKATPRSLFAAITKAAQDGLVPDGREGVITVYKGTAQWNPMAYGLRKRAREIDGILVDAQVIHANDQFDWSGGDEPHITHKIKLGDRGEMIGAYAIFKNAQEGILHREVMDAEQINATRNQSFAKDSLMWTKFVTEGWRKTVVRRGFKSVPCSAPLERLVTRDDENFDFSRDVTPKKIEFPDIPDAFEPGGSTPPEDLNGDDSSVTADPITFLADLEGQLAAADSNDLVMEVWESMLPEVALSGDDQSLHEAFGLRNRRIEQIETAALARTL